MDISADDYVNRHRSLRSTSTENSFRVYLDTRFWVSLRQAEQGQLGEDWPELLALLRARVRDRSAVCLFNYWNFGEIARQKPEWLRLTCELIDELCEGTTLVSPHDLEDIQAEEYVAHKIGVPYDASLDRWTTFARLHKSSLPPLPRDLSIEAREAMLKTLWDQFHSASMHDLLDALGWEITDKFGAKHLDNNTLENFRSLKQDRLARGLQRQQIRVEEFSAVMHDHYSHRFTDALNRIFQRENIPTNDFFVQRLGRAISWRAIREFKGNQLGTLLPQAVITSELSALHFANSTIRDLTDNDYADWQHAAVALPHSHLFLTERTLRAHLQDLRAGQRYGCEVLHDARSAIAYLQR